MAKQDVVKIQGSGNVKEDIKRVVGLMGGIKKYVKRNDKVLVKPSCNSPDPFPATTDIEVIRAVISLIKKQTDNIAVGDSSGVLYKPTRKVFDYMGLTELSRQMNVELIDFDRHKWVTKENRNAAYLKRVSLTEMLDRFDKIIFLPTMRTHRGPGFTMSLKLGVGFMKNSERWKMHARKLKEKIADLNLYFKPDLIIMDGRRCFITGGPERGEERTPNVILGSTSRLALDVEGLKILKKYGMKKLSVPIKEIPVIRVTMRLGL